MTNHVPLGPHGSSLPDYTKALRRVQGEESERAVAQGNMVASPQRRDVRVLVQEESLIHTLLV